MLREEVMGRLLFSLGCFCSIILVLYINVLYTNYVTEKKIENKIIIDVLFFLLTRLNCPSSPLGGLPSAPLVIGTIISGVFAATLIRRV